MPVDSCVGAAYRTAIASSRRPRLRSVDPYWTDELRMPCFVETKLESALVLCAGLSLESHRVVHAREFECRPAVCSRASIGQGLHSCHAVVPLDFVEASSEIGDGSVPLFNFCCRSRPAGHDGDGGVSALS